VAERSVAALTDFLAQSHNVGRGRVAQQSAERYLVESGYEIVGRNWSCKAGEIDLIGIDEDVLCFIEVKARSRPDYGPAIAAVTPSKQRRIARVAALLLAQSGYQGACRFDVIGLDRAEDGWSYTLVQNAFEA
jgi:putative endonuclease